MNKLKKQISLAAILLLAVFFAGEISTTDLSVVKAAETIKVDERDKNNRNVYSKAKSESSIQLKWSKKKGAVEYRIFRSAAAKSTEAFHKKKIKLTKVATVSGKTSYTDTKLKKNRYYMYFICAYKDVKGAKKLFYQEYVEEYTGKAKVSWAEGLLTGDTLEYSPDSIKLEFGEEMGIRPTGYEIYRKEEDGKYNRIAKVKFKSNYQKYTDKKLKTGVKYSYKIRPYFKKNGKTTYGKYTAPFTCYAINQCGKFTTDVQRGDDPSKEIIVKLTCDEKNGKTTLRTDHYDCHFQKSDEIFELEAVEQSVDGKTWEKVSTDKIVLEPGKTIYLKLVAKENLPSSKINFISTEVTYDELHDWTGRELTIYFDSKIAIMSQNL